MFSLIRFFFDVCRLRAGPQQVPASGFLLAVVTWLYLILEIVSGVSYLPVVRAVMAGGLDILVTAAFLQAALKLGGKPERFTQSFTALLGAWCLLGVISLPAVFAVADARIADSDPGIWLFVLLGLLIWSLTIFAHVLRHALEISMGMAIGIAIFYFLLSQMALEIAVPLTTTG